MKELSNVVEAVKYAIQMELDGKKFYSMCAEQSSNKVGQELYLWLAEQEDQHRKKFEEIYESFVGNKDIPAIRVKPDNKSNIRTLFKQAIQDVGTSLLAQKNDLLAAEKAIEMEIKSRDFYTSMAEKATSDTEKSFFSAISSEEQGHYLSLIDYKEYMTDPVGWFTRTEHHSLDG